MIFTALLMAVASALSPAEEPFSPKTVPTKVVSLALDVRPVNHLSLVRARIEGVEAILLFDTGASHTTFDLDFVTNRLPSKTLSPVILAGATNVRKTPSCIAVDRLALGDAVFGGFQAMVVPLGHLAKPVGQRVDGIIGMNLIRSVPTRVSLGSRKVVFNEPRPAGVRFVRAVRPGTAYVGVTIGGRERELLIDTGSTFTFLDSALWSSTGRTVDIAATDVNGADAIRPVLGQRGSLLLGESLPVSPLLVPGARNVLGADALLDRDLIIRGGEFAFPAPSPREIGFTRPVRIVTDAETLEVPVAGTGKSVTIPARPKASRLSARSAHKGVRFSPVRKGNLAAVVTRTEDHTDGRSYTTWRLEMKNGGKEDVLVREIEFFRDWSPTEDADGERVGNTDGAVAVFPSVRVFIGVETPLAKLTVEEGRATAVLPRDYAIRPGETWRFSWSAGSYAEGQLRRDFQIYLNRERAHPYRVLPHYNSWYDINIGRNDAPWEKRMNEAEALGVMTAFREQLSKRGVFIDSYLWDDGWDDWNSLWDFHPGFPNGFRKLADEAHKNKGASIGCWMSPCGGYGGSNAGRVAYARSKGLIGPNEGILRMSSPVYYAAFRDRVIKMITDYDMNLFKFDRLGVGHDCDGAPASHAPDTEAIVRLIGEMRAAKRDVFVNCTVGTWASPYWVMFADSIWRGDQDFGRRGAGRARQQWITYRDNQIHDRFVAKSPLFPLNSLMYHGIIVTRHGPPGCEDVSDSPESTQDFVDEVWMSVASGTDLQEYYITPSIMHPAWWDALADGVKWLKQNQHTLVDSHWVGGDPDVAGGAEVYGYASWAPGKGIVVLRNPSDQPQTFRGSFAGLLELPSEAAASQLKAKPKIIYAHGATFAPPRKVSDETVFSFEPFGMVLIEVTL